MTTKSKNQPLEMNIFAKDVNGENRRVGKIPAYISGKEFDFTLFNGIYKAKPNENKTEVGKADYYIFVEIKKGHEVWVGSIIKHKKGQGFNMLMSQDRYSVFPHVENKKESAA